MCVDPQVSERHRKRLERDKRAGTTRGKRPFSKAFRFNRREHLPTALVLAHLPDESLETLGRGEQDLAAEADQRIKNRLRNILEERTAEELQEIAAQAAA